MTRNIKDAAGRTWSCTSAAAGDDASAPVGRDVAISCTTTSVADPVALTVGWQWLEMSDNGLGRLIMTQSPVPKH